MVQGAGRSVCAFLFSYRYMSWHGQTGHGRDLFVSFNKEGVSAMTCPADAEPEVEAVKNLQVLLIARGPLIAPQL